MIYRVVWACVLLSLAGCSSPRAPNAYLVSMTAPSSTVVAPQPPPPPASSPSSPLPARARDPVVFLDPGHGGHATGAVSRTGALKEKTLALELARRVERLLRKGGYQVILSRKTDVFVSLHRRVQKAEACKATIFVSIHLNSDPAAKGQGAEVYYYRAKKQKDGFRVIESRQLAHQILGHLSKDLSMMCRGVKNGDFYVIRESTMPAVLVEAAFITNPKDALLLASVPCRQKMANAIAKGIIDYFRARK